MSSGRSKCRAEGCTRLVIAKVMLTPPVENEKVPYVGLCGLHATDWLWHLQRGVDLGYPGPFRLKPHDREARIAAFGSQSPPAASNAPTRGITPGGVGGDS